MRALRKRGKALGVVAALAGLTVYAAVAFADVVHNDVETDAELVTVTAGGAGASVGYYIGAASGCDASDGSAVTVTPSGMPSGVTTNVASRTFSACGEAAKQSITFTADATTTPDTYEITVGTTDSSGVYNVTPAKFNLKVDPATATLAAPTVDGALSGGTVGDNDWYTAAPTATWTLGGGAATSFGGHCAFPDASTFRASAPVPSTDTATGSVTCSATNATGTGSKELTYMLDGTAPSSVVSNVFAASYPIGGEPSSVGCAGTDDTSGIATGENGTATADRSGINGNGVGEVTYTCNGAKDQAGNVQTVAGAPSGYDVVYGRDGGILQPINADGSSVFNIKRGVPVKFKLLGDEPTGFDVSEWTLSRESAQCGVEDWTPESVSSDTTSANTGLRYDPAADQYLANATLNGAQVGKCYKLVVGLDDGTEIESPKFKVGK